MGRCLLAIVLLVAAAAAQPGPQSGVLDAKSLAGADVATVRYWASTRSAFDYVSPAMPAPGAIKSLKAPSQAELATALSAYKDEKESIYLSQLKSAWSSAAQAKELAERGTKTSVSVDASAGSSEKPKVTISVTSESSEEDAKTRFGEAVNWAYETLDAMADLIRSDVAELDALGADNPDSSEGLHSLYFGAANLTATIDIVRLEDLPPTARCDDHLSDSVICIRYLRQSAANPDIAAFAFNAIAGYPDKDSLFSRYFGLHLLLQSAKSGMESEYAAEEGNFSRLVAEARSLLDSLEAEDTGKVDEETLSFLASGKVNAIVAGDAATPAARLGIFNYELGRAEVQKAAADRVYDEKADDYLFKTVSALTEINARLMGLKAGLESLSARLVELLNTARKAYESEKAGIGEDYFSPTYSFARGYADKGGTKGEKIANYATAIRIMRLLAECASPDAAYSRIGRMLSQLDKAGFDVSREKLQYGLLKEIDADSISQRCIAIAGLEEKLKGLAESAGAGVAALRERASGYLMDIEKLAQDPALSPYIDAEKLAQFRSDYEVSLTKDIATNSAELSDTYDKMIDYLGPLAGKLASRQAAMDVSPQQAQATAPQAQPPILQVQETPAVPAVAGTAAANTTPTAKKGTLELGEKVIADFEKSVAGLKATSVLLEDFKRASDTKADVAFDVRYVTYSERDYDKFKARLKGLEELATLLSEGGSAPDLKAFVSDARDLADSLNDSLIFLKAQASAEITAAREKYDGNESSYNYVKKALDSFGKGYYNRASIYARAAISPQASAITGAAAPASADFPIGIFAAFSVAAAAAAYALRKPKQPQVKRLLRLPED